MNPLSYKSSPQVQPGVVTMNSLVSQFRVRRLQLSGIPLRGLLLHIHEDLARLPATPTLCGHFATHSCHATQGCRTLLLTVLGNSLSQRKPILIYGFRSLSLSQTEAVQHAKTTWSSWVKAAASIDSPWLFYFTTLEGQDRERLPDCWLRSLLVVLEAFKC